ncbi:Hypothetical protein CINCED_3A001703 [Cinara cedri]|uniref:Uncharacterized protein n=1 Tax=Cinara cedri TaxID=506608 RepID=A0A5E4MP71_9HEMI|nr:Hypothetical protein CINCED_3A001703 [Cinara cedri]
MDLLREFRHDVEKSARKLIKFGNNIIYYRNATLKDNLYIEGFTLEQVGDFQLLQGVDTNEKIICIVKLGCNSNMCYFTMKGIFFFNAQDDEDKLQGFESKILRKIYGTLHNNDLERFERKTNENLNQLFNKPSLRHFLVKKRLEWAAGHIWRAEGSLIKKVAEDKLTGKRPRGRPWQKRYDRRKRSKKVNPLLDMRPALDRERWKSILEAPMS